MPLKERIKYQYQRYEKYLPASFFVAGFLFDVVTLGRIDDGFTMVSQGGYLAIIAFYLRLEMLGTKTPIVPRRWVNWLWRYRDEIVHFLFGSLLSAYTLFYFKSSSLIASGLFLLVMVVLLVANELSRFQQSGVLMRIALFSLSLISYFAYVIPVLAGSIGVVVFFGAVMLSSLLMLGLVRSVQGRVDAEALAGEEPEPVALVNGVTEGMAAKIESSVTRIKRLYGVWRRQTLDVRARHVSLAVAVLFIFLYLFRLIPPVPLSAQYMGIYHQIEKRDGRFVLSYDRPWWKIWQNGAQTFLGRDGDRVYVFARVFAPTSFRDQIRVRWLYRDERRGWQSSDSIPIQISGGREEGFRGYAFKQNWTPGRWRVQLETSDGREIGRIGLNIVRVEEHGPREFETDLN